MKPFLYACLAAYALGIVAFSVQEVDGRWNQSNFETVLMKGVERGVSWPVEVWNMVA